MRKRIRKWTSLIGVMALAFVLAMGIFTPEIFADYTYTASPSCTTNGDNYWKLPPLLKLCVSVNGSLATFTVSKAEGGNFTNNGTLYLKVGSYEPSGFDRGSSSVSIGNPPVTFKENLDDPNLSYKWVGNTLEYFVRDEIDDPPNDPGSRWAWVGPLTITREFHNLPPTPPVITSCPSTVTTPDYTFNWLPSTDPDGYVSQYSYCCDSVCGTTSGTSAKCTNLTNGSHTFSVKAVDNLGATSPVASCSFNVDIPPNKRPTVSITNCPTGNVTALDYTFNWIGSDPDGYVAYYKYGLDSQPDKQTIATSYTWTNIQNGTHTFSVQAVDNLELPSDVVPCTSNVDPIVKILNCPIKPLITSSYIFKWSGNVSDYSVILDDSEVYRGAATSYEWKSLSSGDHTFKVVAHGFKPDGSKVDSPVVECKFHVNFKPTVEIKKCPTSPLTTSSYTFEWSGTDSDGSIVKYLVSKDGSIIDDIGTTTSYEWKDFINGKHTFSVQAVDDSGDIGSATCDFEVDAPPVVEIDCPKDVVGTSSYTFEWKGNVAQYYYCLDDESHCVPKTAISSSSVISYKWDDLTDGDHTFIVQIRDASGNVVVQDVCPFKVEKRPEFYFTIQLTWKDYQRVTREYDAAVWGDGWPGCGSNTDTNEYTQHIPFKQEVILSRNLLHDCRDTGSSTSYLTEGGANWVYFTTQTNLSCEGDLRLKVYARNDPDGNWTNPHYRAVQFFS